MNFQNAKRLYSCPHCCKKDFRKKGFYYRKISKTYIPRYFCFTCQKNFSTQTLTKNYRQKRPDLNQLILKSLTSGTTMRKTAKNLNCNYKTVYRKFLWLSELAKYHHQSKEFFIQELQFDEMESIEHTKLKPLTIALAVSESYQLLGVQVGTIPAKGLLSNLSRKKYGPRLDQSSQAVEKLLRSLKVSPMAKSFLIKSDSKPSYKKIVADVFPSQFHETHIARENKEKRRELKYTLAEKKIFDPIFAANQRMAKLRDHIKRLTRRSWCTTKKLINLESHVYLFMAENNGYTLV